MDPGEWRDQNAEGLPLTKVELIQLGDKEVCQVCMAVPQQVGDMFIHATPTEVHYAIPK